MPDGCMDILWVDGEFLFVGPMTSSVDVQLFLGEKQLGIRFHPGAAGRVLGIAASEVRDQVIPLRSIHGMRNLVFSAEEHVHSAGERNDPACYLEALMFALNKKAQDGKAPDPAIARATALLSKAPSLSLRTIAREVGLCDRHLRRRFQEDVGYSPRVFARIRRFQQFLAVTRPNRTGQVHLATLAAKCGYADQAHLTRECKSFTGHPPSRLLKKMSVSFKTSM